MAFRYPIKLIANALGVPPQPMIEMGRAHGVPVAALVGAKEHAVRQAPRASTSSSRRRRSGRPLRRRLHHGAGAGRCYGAADPRHARAGRGRHHDGRQMAAAMAMGAAGAWCGSVWLTTSGIRYHRVFREKMLAAPRATRSAPGPHRQTLAPAPLAVDRCLGPGQESPGGCRCRSRASSAASLRWLGSAWGGRKQAGARPRDLLVGQGVGLVDAPDFTRRLCRQFKEDFAEAVEHMNALMEE